MAATNIALAGEELVAVKAVLLAVSKVSNTVAMMAQKYIDWMAVLKADERVGM